MPPIKAALTWIALSFALFSGSTSVQAAQQNAPGTVPDDETPAPKAVEAFLVELERELLDRVEKFEQADTRKHHRMSVIVRR